MRIAICDDNEKDLKAMAEMLRCVAPDHRTDVFSDSTALLSGISNGAGYHLLFLDIIMPGLNGMELARQIRRMSPKTQIVFLTDSDAYAIEAFSLRALHYIRKPITEAALEECLLRMKEIQSLRRMVHILSSSGTQQMLFADEIQYAESDAHYCILLLSDGNTIKTRMTQAEIQAALGDSFLSVSRGLVVNAEFIRKIGSRSCVLKDGREVLLSRKKLDSIHDAYGKYVFSQLSQHCQGDGSVTETRTPL